MDVKPPPPPTFQYQPQQNPPIGLPPQQTFFAPPPSSAQTCMPMPQHYMSQPQFGQYLPGQYGTLNMNMPTPHFATQMAAANVQRHAMATTAMPTELDTDPRELEAFAEHFKQRRIKLSVTQADVGKALANLKLPGVGSLSQSTICRFESLTLSHNNMIALKPILEAWLDEAEKSPRDDRKRKRTSIPAAEKRSLETYFRIQPRPSSEKIAAIAEQLDLKKGVVRVWFCNRRQKEKRLRSQTRFGGM